MQLQEKTIATYMDLYKKPSFRKISEDTGINLTRVFRLVNGAPMKLEEYSLFEKKILEKSCANPDFVLKANECFQKLDFGAKKEIEGLMSRLLKKMELRSRHCSINFMMGEV